MILLKIVAALLMTQISEADSNFAARGQFPYHVAIFDKEGSFCSGALIKDNYVVTSASCLMDETGLFPADKYYVLLDFGLGIQTLEKHNIALLRLERKVELNQYVNIVDLPDLNDTFNKTSEGVLTRYQQYMRSYSDFYVTLTFSSSNVTTSSICERNIKKYFIKPKVLSQFCINHILHGKNLKFQSSGIFVQSEGNKTVLTGLAVGN
ncbi:uncharacterized protein LOC111643772, partial [Copidosoma floridanum]|uniref:uncharacterized protein LOC111643772 n=1 Tax=Copidosoma floridanum TaxID=29053 RepID=UPI000C6F8D38